MALWGCTTRQTPSTGKTGFLIELPSGTALSADPRGPANRVADGNPALILEERSDGWRRMLAADGTSGWSETTPSASTTTSVEIGMQVAAVDHSPDEAVAASDIGLSAPVRIVGASNKSAVSSLEENMIPLRRSWRRTPWLKLQAGTTTGWSSPSDVSFTWSGAPAPKGMIRAPFTGRFAALLDSVPRAGARVLRVDSAGGAASAAAMQAEETFSEVRALQIENDRPVAVMFSGERARLLRLMTGSLLFDTYSPELDRVACADLSGNGSRQCAAQVTQVTGDGAFTTLWIVASPTLATSVQIDASSGEAGAAVTEGEWWFDSANHRVWIVRANRMSTKASVVTNGKETPAVAHLAMLPPRDSYDEAVADRIAAAKGDLVVLPVSEGGKVRWAAARLLDSSAAARKWIDANDGAGHFKILATAK